jgi:hypothetical protein
MGAPMTFASCVVDADFLLEFLETSDSALGRVAPRSTRNTEPRATVSLPAIRAKRSPRSSRPVACRGSHIRYASPRKRGHADTRTRGHGNFEGLFEADTLRGNGVGRALALLYVIYSLRYADEPSVNRSVCTRRLVSSATANPRTSTPTTSRGHVTTG